MVGAAFALLWSAPAMAQERQRYDLAEGDAAQRVQAVAIQSGVQVIAPSADLAGVRTRPVAGEYTPAEALRQMLAGTGLEVASGSGGALVVTRPSAGSTALGSVAASQASAEIDAGAAQDSQNVFVTGTRIVREGVDTIRAATVTDEAEFERRAYTNVIQALSDTPGFAAPASGQVQTTQAALGVAQSFSNFFGLGSQRTLTLVNGRRFVSSNTVSGTGGPVSPGSQVDLNLINVGLVERVETVAIGGAPVYGSDAISGTVNVILKDDYEGLELTGQASLSERGDAASQAVRGLFGHNFMEGRGNIVLGAEYVRQEPIILSDRFPALALLGTENADDRTDGLPALVPIEQVFALMTEGGLPFVAGGAPNEATLITVNGADASDTNLPLQFANGGVLIPFVRGARYFGDSGGALRNGGQGVNPGDHINLVAPNERYLLNALGNFDVTENINLFFEASYAHTEATELSELYQFAAPGVGGPLLTFSIDNPFLPAETRDILRANGVTSTFRLNRNLNDIADSQPTRTELDVWRVVVGARGDFELWDKAINWDVAYNYGHSRNRSELNQINLERFLAAIDVVTDASGNIACRSGGSCIPLNIFGEGSFTPEAAAAVIDQGVGISENSLEEITANIGGRLPFGIAEPIAFSIGYAHRTENGSFEGNDVINNGLSLLAPLGAPPPWPVAFPDAPERGFNTDEIYAEAAVPLVDDEMGWPVIRRLEFEGAARYVSHSSTGGAVTWSAGGRFEPRIGRITDGLMIRGVFTHAIRSPSIVELFLNATPVARNANDVCAPSRIDQGPNPAVRRANCTAALAAVGVNDPTAFVPTTSGASPFGVIGGNPDLDNEEADSWSVGFVWQPPAIPRLRINADYTEIDLTGAITRFTLGTAQSACYDSPNFPDEGACDAFSRLTAAEAAAQSAATGRTRIAGDIADGYLESYFNSQRIDFAGIIGEVDYRVPVPNFVAGPDSGSGAIRLNLKVFHISRFRTQTSGAAPIVETAGELGTPKWRVSGRVGFVFDPFDLDVNVIWTDNTVLDLLATDEDIAPEINNVPSYTLVNTALGVRLEEDFFLQFSVRNLFDRKVPFPGIVQREFGIFDPIGRTYTATATVRF
ncbi:TonB-dependent receptor [Sphingosinicella sp. CPCC 101087]|uniref:TonB-dependent receptor n=1 Tax=Sphingosinicella sp. CPCC 101087 TaxID=2497754 RepID=UPI0013EAFC50|nr:TonB-dependent receptor [Sphingosinicella sp. CPCC 101087]